MRTPLTLIASLALACLPGSATAALDLSAQGISAPIFDPAGKLTHRLLAKRATLQGQIQTLYGVELQMLSPDDPTLVVQKLEADDAVWDSQRQTLVGKGGITVTAADNELRGRGFEFTLATSRLLIRQDFSLQNPELSLASDRATIDLRLEKNDREVKFRDVNRCEAEGNVRVVVNPEAAKKLHFEKAYSDRAIYDGTARTVQFPNPTRTLAGSYEVNASTLTINLNKPGKTLPLKTPAP